MPAPAGRSNRYRLFDTTIATAPSCSSPSGPRHRRSGIRPGPRTSGTVSSTVRSFALAVARVLDRLPVHSERDVVDEGAAVDLTDVDPSLAPFDERVERPDDVVPVDAEIEREVVASARRDARVRETALCCDPGDDRL